ncbi:hypothetical protein, partial [Streptomyces cyaneofuscatus]|uniref:hypothetical protein n=1 Tax=Streptomyces cyaneofuscatus TaxID=66883 RepID=UPI0037F16037
PINHTDPTGQSPEDAWNWFNNNILSWEGLPYIDIGIAGLGVVATAASGGAAAPLAIALIGLAATVPAAADQIAINTTGKGFMPDTVRTAFDVAAFAGDSVSGFTGVLLGVENFKNAVRAGKSGSKTLSAMSSNNEMVISRGASANNERMILPDTDRVQVSIFRKKNRSPEAFNSERGPTIYHGSVTGSNEVTVRSMWHPKPGGGAWQHPQEKLRVSMERISPTVLSRGQYDIGYSATSNWKQKPKAGFANPRIMFTMM